VSFCFGYFIALYSLSFKHLFCLCSQLIVTNKLVCLRQTDPEIYGKAQILLCQLYENVLVKVAEKCVTFVADFLQVLSLTKLH